MWNEKEFRLYRKEKAMAYLGDKCADCGNSDRRVLEFHHAKKRRSNGCTIASLLKSSWLKLKKELDKCKLLCANCHKIRTTQQIKHINRGVGL